MTLREVLSRDGTWCVWCGRVMWPRDLTVEHLLPRARGGRGVPENLAVACRRCNRRRGAKPAATYVRERLQAGEHPEIGRLRGSLARLSGSQLGTHAEYGRRQLALLGRIADSGSFEHERLPGEASGVKIS